MTFNPEIPPSGSSYTTFTNNMEATFSPLGFATPEYYPPQATVSLAETTFMPSPEPSVKGEEEKKSQQQPTKKRKSWGQELPIPKTNLPPRYVNQNIGFDCAVSYSHRRKRAKTEDEKEQRRIERVLRNRQAAQSSRERKRQEVEKLEGEKMSIEEQNKMLKERLMTVEHEKFKLAQQVAKLTAEMSKYRSGSLAPPSVATSCAPSPSLQPELFPQTNIKQEFDDFAFSLPTPQSSAIIGSSLSPPSTSSASSRSTSPAHGSFGVMTSSPDMTQHPAEMLCGLQCQSGAATAASTAATSRDEARRRKQRRMLFTLCTQVYWMTLISAVYSHLLHPLRLIFISLRTGSPLPISSTTTTIPPMISLLIRWLISTPANLTTTTPPPTKAASSTTLSPPPPTFRIRLLRRLLLCSPTLARPLKDAAGGASRLRTSYALNGMSKGRSEDVLVVSGGKAASLGKAGPQGLIENGERQRNGTMETSSMTGNVDLEKHKGMETHGVELVE